MLEGNTVRLRADFKDYNGAYYDPNDLAVKVYNNRMSVIHEGVPIQEAVGRYYYDYTLTKPDYAFEFSGTIVGVPVLSRMSLRVGRTY